ncbi:MAG: protein of unknown function containing DUF3576 domain [Rhodobacteraceae bacterium HLUCCA12]|nr:MAG: protein of unknown function containing DUF3576 domain [Rhodobacteraceae bacterium HLUCCA12]
MSINRAAKPVIALALVTALSACGGGGLGNMFSEENSRSAEEISRQDIVEERVRTTGSEDSIWDLFGGRDEPDTTIAVNRYIWTAALDVLDFLPVETVDPFSGVFTTGFGAPPGGGRPYRATVHVTDVALDARSLNVALVTRNGPASDETVRAVENAILNRARQFRIRDRNL